MSPFTAMYPGTCANCETRIFPGQPVRFGDFDLVHEACPAATPGRDVCVNCFLVLPTSGICGTCD